MRRRISYRLIGRRLVQFVIASDRSAFSAFLGTIVTSRNKVQCEVTLLKKVDFPLIMQIEAMAAASGQGSRLALIDITGRRQAVEALRESEERMYKLAEMAVVAIIMLDDSGTVMFCNAATQRKFGCPAAEITGWNFHWSFPSRP